MLFDQACREALAKACEPGQLLLGRTLSPWIQPTFDLLKSMTPGRECGSEKKFRITRE